MQQLNSAMTAMARVLQAIDNCAVEGASDELVSAMGQMRDTFWRLKETYPEYATDQPYTIQIGTGGPGIVVVGAAQQAVQPVVVVEDTYYPGVIVIDDM
jgi:hypothetical protein